jgi:hypothetical protein
MYNRIAGVPPSAASWLPCWRRRSGERRVDRDQGSAFYNNTIRNMATPWTNRDQTVFVPLNDYTATVVGMVRDDVPFNTLLSADLVYIAGSAPPLRPAGLLADNNNMYAAMDATTTSI